VTKPAIIWFSAKFIILSILFFCYYITNTPFRSPERKEKKSKSMYFHKLIIVFIHVNINHFFNMVIQFWLNIFFASRFWFQSMELSNIIVLQMSISLHIIYILIFLRVQSWKFIFREMFNIWINFLCCNLVLSFSSSHRVFVKKIWFWNHKNLMRYILETEFS
jgi:hypothetical protein